MFSRGLEMSYEVMNRYPFPAQAGRPRKPETDQANFSACIRLLSEQCFDATTIDAVATKSGVRRPTIYRRFAVRKVLIEEVVSKILKADVEVVEPDADPKQHILLLVGKNLSYAGRHTGGRHP